MDFDRDWHTFSLDAEVDAYGTSRIAGAHNRLREENARLTEKLARCVEALEQIDRETRSASDVAALRYGSIARVVLAAAKGSEK